MPLILYCPTVDYIKRSILILFYFHFSIGNVQKYPRTRVWDPYRRLGISRDASEEEIWGLRNFLLEQYSGHERSAESIEAAFEIIPVDSFQQRKKTKLKNKVEESPPWIKNLLNFVELLPTDVIFRRLFLFAFMGGWSIMNSAEGGPAFQFVLYFLSWFSIFISNGTLQEQCIIFWVKVISSLPIMSSSMNWRAVLTCLYSNGVQIVENWKKKPMALHGVNGCWTRLIRMTLSWCKGRSANHSFLFFCQKKKKVMCRVLGSHLGGPSTVPQAYPSLSCRN